MQIEELLKGHVDSVDAALKGFEGQLADAKDTIRALEIKAARPGAGGFDTMRPMPADGIVMGHNGSLKSLSQIAYRESVATGALHFPPTSASCLPA